MVTDNLAVDISVIMTWVSTKRLKATATVRCSYMADIQSHQIHYIRRLDREERIAGVQV